MLIDSMFHDNEWYKEHLRTITKHVITSVFCFLFLFFNVSTPKFTGLTYVCHFVMFVC